MKKKHKVGQDFIKYNWVKQKVTKNKSLRVKQKVIKNSRTSPSG